MESDQAAFVSKKRLWAGRIMSGIVVLFLIFDGVTKLMKVAPVVEGMQKLGYPVPLAPAIGAILLICLIVYVIPRTAPFGAILLTGYLGGAVASQLRIEMPLLGYTLFPIYVAVLAWGGLYLRDSRVRSLFAPPAS
ncbi:MAG TPA: DoxX family protein [Gemmatimonadaceae bacterium]|nr:DoxX family protein [Gemmatimonadaceae bacterium]